MSAFHTNYEQEVAHDAGMAQQGIYHLRGAVELAPYLNAGGLIYLAEGDEYTISDPVTITYPTKVSLRGVGRQRTIINVSVGITIETEDIADSSDSYNLTNWSSFQGVTFFGPSARNIDCFTVDWASRLFWSDCELRRFRSAVVGSRMWDSEFLNTAFVNCGDSTHAMVILQRLANGALAATFTNSNNIAFTNCHWEPTLGIGLLLSDGTCGCRVLGSKFHGDLPSPVAYDHLKLASGAYANLIHGNCFVNCGASGITLDDSDGNSIMGNRFAACVAGMTFANSPADNAVVGNSFGIGAGSSNTADISGSTSGNEVANNPGA